MQKRTPIKKLFAGALDSQPVFKDWSGTSDDDEREYRERDYEVYEAAECYECGKVTNAQGVCINEDCDRFERDPMDSCEGPMMNYFYPLPTEPVNKWGFGSESHQAADLDEAAARLVNLPLCIVSMEDPTDTRPQWGLALTGGGMDLSWEICEGFMLLGYLPPVHFASNLPGISGRGTSKRDKWIIAGCIESLAYRKREAADAISRLKGKYRKQGKQAA